MTDRKCVIFFFFNNTATTEIYTLSLHDALPIYTAAIVGVAQAHDMPVKAIRVNAEGSVHLFEAMRLQGVKRRSEEHTSELQSRQYLVCRLLLEKKKF